MIGFGRDKMAKAAQELADHLALIDNVRALQVAQKEMADAIQVINNRLRDIEVEMRVVKSDTTAHALRETQLIVNAVQGGLNQRIETLAVKVAVLENNRASDGNIVANRLPGDAAPRALGHVDEQ